MPDSGHPGPEAGEIFVRQKCRQLAWALLSCVAMLTRVSSYNWRKLAWQAFWAFMLVGHAPAWLASCRWPAADTESFDALRCLILTISQALFLLKVLDVRWLRLKADRRTWLTVTIAIALLHSGVVHQLVFDQPLTAEAYQAVLLSAPLTIVIATLSTMPLPLSWQPVRRRRRSERAAWARAFARVQTAVLPPRFLLLSRSVSLHRAPPC